uniref:SURF1-like protein n=1 Tax=Hemiselmis tepida TaxID=464990 RepID=A0A7S0W1V5_9CRYP|mmetsp:Transcript_35778/g.91368  ORF Transcript_35778/g.91368 Transcript_35778/m.91368 type:complete len:144 (+) Transcript_35778:56-487(+)
MALAAKGLLCLLVVGSADAFAPVVRPSATLPGAFRVHSASTTRRLPAVGGCVAGGEVRHVLGRARMSLVSELSDAPLLTGAAFVGFNVWYLSGILQSPQPTPDPYSVISDLEVLKVTDGKPIPVSQLWGEDERAVVMLMRSFG